MKTRKSAYAGISRSLREIGQGRYQRTAIKVPSVRQIRLHAGMTQEGFAQFLGISLKTLQNWEQGRRRPTGPALTLLRVVYLHPEILPSGSVRRAA
jgi:putative transcriptional regulator